MEFLHVLRNASHIRRVSVLNLGAFSVYVKQPFFLHRLLTADFAAVVVLISMGAILGKLSPTQYIIMAFLETPAAAVIEHAAVHKFEASQFACSHSEYDIYIHSFTLSTKFSSTLLKPFPQTYELAELV